MDSVGPESSNGLCIRNSPADERSHRSAIIGVTNRGTPLQSLQELRVGVQTVDPVNQQILNAVDYP